LAEKNYIEIGKPQNNAGTKMLRQI
jgi:hypothetical protein